MKQITIVCCLLTLLSFNSFAKDSTATVIPVLFTVITASIGINCLFRAYELRQDAVIARNKYESNILMRRSDDELIWGTFLGTVAVISFRAFGLSHKKLYLSTSNFGLSVNYKL